MNKQPIKKPACSGQECSMERNNEDRIVSLLEDIKNILLSQRDLYFFYSLKEDHEYIFDKKDEQPLAFSMLFPEPYGILTQEGKIAAPLCIQKIFKNVNEELLEYYKKDTM